MSSIVRLLGFLFSFVFILGCGEVSLDIAPKNSSASSSLSGFAVMFSTSFNGTLNKTAKNDLRAFTCTSGTATIHALDTDGSINATARASTTIGIDGYFEFSESQLASISISPSSIQYLIKASGCGNDYYRPITGVQEQNVSGFSTLLAMSTYVDDPLRRKLSTFTQEQVETALTQFSSVSATDLTAMINTIIANTTLRQKYESLTGVDISVLKNLPPQSVTLDGPTSAFETTSYVYSAVPSTWNTEYQPAYEWRLDGTTVSTNATWTYHTNRNSQGEHQITLSVGAKDTAGYIDSSKPVKSVSLTTTVANNFPPLAPDMVLVGNPERNFRSGAVTMDTGVLRTNCDSFSDLALIEGTFLTPQDSDFTISCTAAGTENIPFLLSPADGAKTLALWARDAAGNISETPTVVTITLDQTAPSLSLASIANVKGGSSFSIIYSAADSLSGLASVKIAYAQNGTTFTDVADVTTSPSPLVWSVPSVNVTTAKIKITANDQAGNTTQQTSSAFAIDSIAPALTITSPAANTTAQAGVTLTGACESGLVLQISGAITPTPQTLTCPSGAYNQNITFTSGDGTKNIVVTQADASGNATSVNRDFLKDTTAPAIAFTSPTANTQAKAGLVISGSCETGLSVEISGSGVDTPSTATCASGAFTEAITFSAVDGAKSVTISQTDGVGNNGSASRSFVRNNAAPDMILTGPADGTNAQSGVTLVGTCDNAFTVDVAGAGTTSNGSFACSAGVFSIPITFTAGDGNKVITVAQTDSLSNTVSYSRTYVRDSVAPTLTQTALALTTYSVTNTVTYQGACETGIPIQISGAELSSVSCVSSAWSFSTSKTSDGSYAYAFTQVDSAGNQTQVSASWIRDTILPSITLNSLTGGQLIKGAQNTSVTWSATDTVGLAATNPISIEYSLNGGSSWNSVISSTSNTGTYTWALPGFNSSTVRVRVKATDLAGNTAIAASATNFTVDSTAPIVTLTSLTGGQVIAGGQNYSITWTATDTNMDPAPIDIEISADSGSTWSSPASGLANSGAYTWSVPAANSSTYRVRVTAKDLLNQSTTSASSANFTIDSAAPSVTLTSHTGGQYVAYNSNQNVTWSSSDLNFSSTPITLSVSANGGTDWTILADSLANTGSYTWKASLATGSSYRLKITARDVAGNVGASASSSNFTISSGAPVLTQTTLASPYVGTGNQVTFGGACQTGLSIAMSGNETGTISCSGSGTWTLTTSSYTTDGTRDYTFSQTNGASETSSVSARWQRITAAPSIASVLINNDDSYTPSATVNVAVTTSQNVGVKVRFAVVSGGATSCQAQYANSGWIDQTNLTTTHTVVLSSGDGTKKVCVWAKDQANNISVYSPVAGTLGVDTDTIDYASGNPPRVTRFDAINNVGGSNQGTQFASSSDGLKISWDISDVEGLANNPVYLDYTLDGSTWIPIESGYGSLTSNPTTYTADYYGFSAPSNGFFRLRLRVKDLAGNTSSEYYSKAFNIYPWSVVAGSLGRGEGGSAKSLTIGRDAAIIRNFAFNPITGDLYYMDTEKAVMKVSAQTGIAKKFLSHSTSLTLSSSGTLDTSKGINTMYDHMLFDKKGYLYIVSGSVTMSSSTKVFRVNPDTLQYTTYLSGGASNGSTATASNAFVAWGGHFAFDESNSLYFATSCTPNSWNYTTSSTSRLRLMKVAQNSDGTPGSMTIVAGDCVAGTPVSGTSATATPFSISQANTNRARITVWNNGNAIYYTQYTSGNLHKIVNGVYYTTNISLDTSGDLEYNAGDGYLYVTRSYIKAYTPNLTGANGDTEVTAKRVLGTSTSAGCKDDGVSGANVCAGFYGAYSTPSGRMFFVEGNVLNRLRYFDDSGNIQTLAGSLGFTGDGKTASLAKGLFSGIYYKKSTELLSSVYPEGLYFMEYNGGVFGYFDTSWDTHNLWGNQSGNTTITTGTVISPSLSAGYLGYGSGNLYAFTFDDQGMPWVKNNGQYLAKLDQNKKYNLLTVNSVSANWHEGPVGGDPRDYRLQMYGGMQNFTLAPSNKLFLLGTYYSSAQATSASNDPNPKLRVFDYDNNTIMHIMGDVAPAVTAQQTSVGSLQTKSISSSCRNTGCSIQYVTDQDRLYMAEGSTLRYITHPLDPAQHTLIDVFTATGTIQNFTVSPNRKYVFYTLGGYLYCHAFSSADNSSICKNVVASHVKLGPPTGLDTIDRGPNQMTWKDDTTLFISTYKGEIYQYTIEP